MIAWRLLEGRYVSNNEIIDALYGDREDGGPDYAVRCVWKHLDHVRRWPARRGVIVQTHCGRGYCISATDIPRTRSALASEIHMNT